MRAGIILVGIVIVILVIFGTLIFNGIKSNNICETNGFDYSGKGWIIQDQIKVIEPGYISCCKEVYINHIKKQDCSIIKR